MSASLLIGALIVLGFAVMLAGVFVSMFSEPGWIQRPLRRSPLRQPSLRLVEGSGSVNAADWAQRQRAGRGDRRVA